MQYAMMYMALMQEEVDVIAAYSTDSRIGKFNLVLLEDDKQFFPDYSAAFVLPLALTEKYPGLVGVIEKLSGKIDEKAMAAMNLAFDEGETPRISHAPSSVKNNSSSRKKFAEKGKKWYLLHLLTGVGRLVFKELDCS